MDENEFGLEPYVEKCMYSPVKDEKEMSAFTRDVFATLTNGMKPSQFIRRWSNHKICRMDLCEKEKDTIKIAGYKITIEKDENEIL